MEKLEPAVIEITSVPMDFKAVNDKDELVKQHMKIAEEAIAGSAITHWNAKYSIEFFIHFVHINQI